MKKYQVDYADLQLVECRNKFDVLVLLPNIMVRHTQTVMKYIDKWTLFLF